MKKLLKLILALSIVSTFSACTKSKPESIFTFHLAQTRVFGMEKNIQQKELPLSGMSCKMDDVHFMSSNEISEVDIASVRLVTGDTLEGFYFTTTTLGRNRLMKETAANQGAFIILCESKGKDVKTIVGARQIDSVITDGKIFITPEIEFENPEDIDKLIIEWKESVKRHRAIRDGYVY